MEAKKLTHKQLRAVELLANGFITCEKVAEECHVTPTTISNWRRKPDFNEAVLLRSRELLKDMIPDIYHAVVKKARLGSSSHIKIVFDHLAELEGKVNKRDDTITIRWDDGTKEDSQ